MEAESKKEVGGDALDSSSTSGGEKVKKKGIISRIWNGLFRLHGDDFEKRLQHISKEEAAVLARMKRRSQSWRKMARNIIIFSVIFEVVAVVYAIMTTRSSELSWKMRALRVLPMFLFPGLSSLFYSALVSFTKMCDRKDQKTLEKLRAERQAKIDELKEKTNYYTTQQLIQRYDPDPAAKAAAATVLASKLGADSGLKVYMGEESKIHATTGKTRDAEIVQSTGLRNRKQAHTSGDTESNLPHHSEEEMLHRSTSVGPENSKPLVVEHYSQTGTGMPDGGWLARFAALLVGEDPTQSYALICGNCHMHNGLARKEDFPYITYYCPHCNALNRPKQLDERISDSSTPKTSTLTAVSDTTLVKNADSAAGENVTPCGSPVSAIAAETKEAAAAKTKETTAAETEETTTAAETKEESDETVPGDPVT